MRQDLPTGTVTFLFTDIEGSTRLVAGLGPGYPPVLERHGAILRRALAEHGGIEVSTEGDAFFAAFTSPAQAVEAAIAAQRSLAAEPWPEGFPVRVRMGLHTGEGRLGGDDYVGLDVHRAARIAGVGHGGQVVLSASTRALVDGSLPEGVRLGDLGSHRVKDLDQPEHLAQLVIAGLQQEFPPLRSLGSFSTNLPPQLTSFVGRERELSEVVALAERHRLVSLVGVGGTGKTRLMIQAGAALLEHQPDGVWLVELAAISDPELVVAQVARSLGVAEEPGRDRVLTLLDFLRGKKTLVLLDNCEHLITASGMLVERLLESCPQTTVMTSSREALGISGEVLFQVPSLGLPDGSWSSAAPGAHAAPGPGPDEVAASDAVRLFVDRATAVLPEFRLTTTNTPAIVEICRRLDGIPLAIELAAARVSVLSPEEIAAGLGDRFRLLTGGRRGAVPRQQTLQALIDWSWQLLSEPDQQLLARLSVFAGGWTLDEATALVGALGDGPPDRIGVLDGLARLVDRSLVLVERTGATRYRMLETIRQYARERLVAAGEADLLGRAHLAVFLELALRAEEPMRGPELVPWLRRFDLETDNLRAALEWGLEADPERAIRLTLALVPYWRSRAFGSEAVERVVSAARVALALPSPPADKARERTILVARILAAASQAQAFWGTAVEAPAYAERAVRLAREAGDPLALTEAIGAQAITSVFVGRGEHVFDAYDELSRLTAERHDGWTASMIEAGASQWELATGDTGAAERRLDRATQEAVRLGNPAVIAFVALNRGRVAGHAGRLEDARRWFGQAIERYREIGDLRFELVARSDLAHALRRGGALDEAEASYRVTINDWHHLGNQGAIANQLEAFAFLALSRGAPLLAARLLGAAEAIRSRAGAAMLPPEKVEYEGFMRTLGATLEPAALAAAWSQGQLMSTEEAVQLAIAGDDADAAP